MSDAKGFATRAIHHAYDPMQNEGALTPPVHLTSTFVFENAEAGGEMFAGEREGHIYSRISNPTCALLDVNLQDEQSLPVAEALAARGIPFVLATGYGMTAELKEAYPPCAIVQKPFSAESLKAAMVSVGAQDAP